MADNLENLYRLYLTGFMGSGKTTVGAPLATRLGWHFYDLDSLIEASIHSSIAAFFSEQGEPAFRRIEKHILRDTATIQQAVIALGGGAVCTESNASWVAQNGIVIYLEASVEQLVARLLGGRESRPMLLKPDGTPFDESELIVRISGLLDRRIPFYQRAHYTIDTDHKSVSTIIDEIISLLGGLSRS